MCVVCGCSNHRIAEARDAAFTQAHAGDLAASGPAVNEATGDLHYGTGPARVSVPGMSPTRAIQIETDVLGENNRIATANRAHFQGHGVTALNLVSSPGSGKTSLLVATLLALQQRAPALELGVIEGDQQTSNDAERIRATGVAAIQVNTGKGCHLDAPMIAQAFARLTMHGHGHRHRARTAIEDVASGALLFIENVGNLVCPAMWDLGEAAKVVVLSVTEGEDKPLKYPDMFAAAQLMVLSKTDLLPHLDFDVDRCVACARQVNPGIEVLQLSSRSGQGMDEWLDWLLTWRGDVRGAAPVGHGPGPGPGPGQLHIEDHPDADAGAQTESLRRREAELEAQHRASGPAG